MGPADIARVSATPRAPSPRARALLWKIQRRESASVMVGVLLTSVTIFGEIGVVERSAHLVGGAVPILICGVFVCLALKSLVDPILAIRGRRAAFVSGAVAIGSVRSFERDDEPESEAIVLEWTFADPRAREFRGTLEAENESVFGELAITLAPRTEILVLYDPRHPKRNTIWIE